MDLLEVIRNNKELTTLCGVVALLTALVARKQFIIHRYDGPPGGRAPRGGVEPSRTVLRQRASIWQTSRTIFGLWALGSSWGPPGALLHLYPGRHRPGHPWTGQPPPQSLNGLPPTRRAPAIPGRTLYPADWEAIPPGCWRTRTSCSLLRICAIAALALLPCALLGPLNVLRGLIYVARQRTWEFLAP